MLQYIIFVVALHSFAMLQYFNSDVALHIFAMLHLKCFVLLEQGCGRERGAMGNGERWGMGIGARPFLSLRRRRRLVAAEAAGASRRAGREVSAVRITISCPHRSSRSNLCGTRARWGTGGAARMAARRGNGPPQWAWEGRRDWQVTPGTNWFIVLFVSEYVDWSGSKQVGRTRGARCSVVWSGSKRVEVHPDARS